MLPLPVNISDDECRITLKAMPAMLGAANSDSACKSVEHRAIKAKLKQLGRAAYNVTARDAAGQSLCRYC